MGRNRKISVKVPPSNFKRKVRKENNTLPVDSVGGVVEVAAGLGRTPVHFLLLSLARVVLLKFKHLVCFADFLKHVFADF